MRRLFARSTAALALIAGGLAVAQPRPVLHEDLASPRASRPDVVGSGEAGRNPTAFAAGEKLLPEPAAADAGDDPVFGRPSAVTDRQTEHTPNNQTASDGTLFYTEVFNPAIVPFKRMSALDAVAADYDLHVGSPALADLPVGGAPRPGADRFWATLQVDLRPGKDVAIPSVAADMRILSYEATPRVALTFSRDGADNYYVRSDEAAAAGVHRLVFLAEADPRYFVAPLPRRTPLTRLDERRVRPLPAKVRAVAARALRHLRLDRSSTVDVALDRMVGYFRAFEPGDPPPDTGDIYWDLFRSQRGVCRHRAFAFMITANALGIPTRFLANEAHAWVEVHLPGGWSRIDLGGAALELDVTGGDDKAMYQPRGEDPFDKPEVYADNYTRLTGDIRGLTEQQIREARTPRPRGPSDGGDGEGGGRDGEGRREGRDDGRGASRPGPGRGLPQIDLEEVAARQPTRIAVTSASESAFRGEAIRIAGQLRGGAGGIGGLRVELFLARAGDDGDGARMVGHTTSAADGSFAADVVLPSDLDLDRYEVFAATPGDATWQPSVSR